MKKTACLSTFLRFLFILTYYISYIFLLPVLVLFCLFFKQMEKFLFILFHLLDFCLFSFWLHYRRVMDVKNFLRFSLSLVLQTRKRRG